MRLFWLLTLAGVLTGIWPDSARASTLLYAFASGSPGSIYTVDPGTGEATFFKDIAGTTDLSDGDFLNNELYLASVQGASGWEFGKVSMVNGVFTSLAATGSDQWAGIAAVPSENSLYAIGYYSHNLLSITPEGIATIIGINFPSIVDLAYDVNHDVMYGVSEDTLYTIDRKAGTWSYLNYLQDTSTPRLGLTYHPALDILFLNNGNTHTVYTVNTNTGELAWLGTNGSIAADLNLDGLAAADLDAGGGAVPEPSGWLLGLGGCGLLTVLRKRLRLG